MKLLLLSLLAIITLLGLSFDQSFAEEKYGSSVNGKKIGLTEEGKKYLKNADAYNPRSTGVIFKICLDSPWSTYGWEEASYGTWDQQELKQHVVSKCVEPDANFSLWPTGKVYLLAIAPSSNLDEHKVDTIGGSDNPIICASSDAGTVRTGASDSGFMTEIGHDTGVFAGSISLGGPSYKRITSENGAYQYGGTNDGDPFAKYGSIKTCGLKASNSGAFTVTWEYNEDEFVSKTVKYSYREADVKFGKDIYYPGETAKVIVHDRDLLRWSWDNKAVPVHVWSDSDKSGVNVGVTYDRQFWIPVASDGRSSGDVELSLVRESIDSGENAKSSVLYVQPGDNIYMEYRDYTMPPPFSEDNCNQWRVSSSIDQCEYKRITNVAKISDKSTDSSLTLTTSSDNNLPKISFFEQSASVNIPDNALQKYSNSGKYMVKTWWEHDRKCILPLIPSYIAFITGTSLKELSNSGNSGKSKLKIKTTVLSKGSLFILGFSIVFVSLGLGVSYLGTVFSEAMLWVERIGGALIILFGLHLLGILKINLLNKQKSFNLQNKSTKKFGLLLVGMGFGAGWTPCIGPILASILTLAATSATFWAGGQLLGMYSLGLAIPFLISALAIDQFTIFFQKIRKWIGWIERISAILLIAIGIILITGSVSVLVNFTEELF